MNDALGYWREPPEEQTGEPICEKCGCDAYCNHNGAWLCIEHAVDMFSEELETAIDPAGQGFEVDYDVRTSDGVLTAFVADWKIGDMEFEATIPIEELEK